MAYVENTEWEILGSDQQFHDFQGITTAQKQLRYIKSPAGNFWASDDHKFIYKGKETRVGDLPKFCKVKGIGKTRVCIKKTHQYKIDDAYDIIECKAPGHLFVINGSIATHNCDEFAFVRDNIQQTFWTSISPTLATGGSCIIASTPNGDVDLFSQLWRGANIESPDQPGVGVNGFAAQRVKWDEPPGRDSAFKEKEIAKITLTKWLQEYECEFISSDPLLIDSMILANIKAELDRLKPVGKSGDIIFYKNPQPGMTYLIGGDLATGTGSDYTVFVAYEFPSLEQVAEFRSNTTSSIVSYHMLKKMIKIFEKMKSSVYFTVENNGVGEGVITLFEADEHPPETAEFVSETGQKRKGMTTTAKSKMQACLAFKEMVERGSITMRSPIVLSELSSFVRAGGAYKAKSGATDDAIMATIQVVRMISEIAKFDDSAYDKMYSGSFMSETANDHSIEQFNYSDGDEGYGTFV